MVSLRVTFYVSTPPSDFMAENMRASNAVSKSNDSLFFDRPPGGLAFEIVVIIQHGFQFRYRPLGPIML
jgi:hypothetical protein